MSAPVASLRAIVLIGLPGAGKSTIGRNLAKRLARSFLDTDHVLEQRLGRSIQQIFEREGEERFRDLESEVLRDALHGPVAAVVATGGGIIKRAKNRALISDCGVVFYLHATPRDLATRLRHDVRRPLLQGGDRLHKFEQLFEERHTLYGEVADFTVESIGRPLNSLMQEISELIEVDRSTRAGPACGELPDIGPFARP